MAAELLAAVVANERCSRLARWYRRASLTVLGGGGSGGFGSLELFQRLVLVLLEPGEGALHCVCVSNLHGLTGIDETYILPSS